MGSGSEAVQSPGAESTASNGKREADGSSGQSAKKKKPGPGSRGVANLTPEQLAKKRANGELLLLLLFCLCS